MDRLADRSLSAASLGVDSTAELPARADVVVIGGGIIGSSIALHAARAGISDVVLIDQNTLTSGTTWHAAGLIAGGRGSIALTELARCGPAFYQELEERTGIDIAVTLAGSISIARTAGRVDELIYAHDVASHAGVEAELVDPARIQQMWPLASVDGMLSGLHFPGDGYLNPGYASLAMAEAAHQAGVLIFEHAAVIDLLTHTGHVRGVQTQRGVIRADVVVLAAGLWTRDLGALAGVSLPLYAAEHVHVRSASIDSIRAPLPVLRDVDNSYYIRTEGDRLLVGAFEPRGLPRPVSEIASGGHAEFEPNWEHFAPIRHKAERTVPSLERVGYDRFINAPESFTPDTNFLMGETAEIRGLFVAAGMNSQGIIYAPGVGRELSRWIIDGAPGFDAASVDVRRFSQHQSNRSYLHERTRESLGRLYAMHWPHYQSTTARGIRRTPLHDVLRQRDARFGEINGLERANWFGGPQVDEAYTYGRPGWFDRVAQEHRATREAVTLFDLSAFAKFEIAGPQALELCQWIATADVDVPVGRVVYTLFLNAQGGIELDGTITRIAEDRFLVVTPSTSHTKALWHLTHHARDWQAEVFDATTSWATIGVMGPRSRTLMRRVSPNDWSNAAHPLYSARSVEVAGGFGWVLRLSYAGELGYEVYVPTDLAASTYEALWEAGADLGIRPAGFFALDSLRLEKGYLHLGHDMGSSDDPFSAGLGFTIGRGKDAGFLGSQALSQHDPGNPRHRTVHVRIDDPDAVLVHDETVLCGDRQVGRLTSGAFGHTLGFPVGIAVVEADCDLDADYAVRCRGALYLATLSAKPFYDPQHARMRADESAVSESGGAS